nr:hypothetical protein [Actinocrinis puniceicyclus]
MCGATAWPITAIQVHGCGQVQPSLIGRETADVSNQLHTPDQVRDRRRVSVRPGQIPAFAAGDSGDALLAHQPGYDSAADRDALALQFAGDTERTVGRMRRVHLDDHGGQPLIVVLAFTAFRLASSPSAVVATVGDHDPARPPHAEPAAARVHKREALPRRSLMDQRSRRLAKDLVLSMQILDVGTWPSHRAASARTISHAAATPRNCSTARKPNGPPGVPRRYGGVVAHVGAGDRIKVTASRGAARVIRLGKTTFYERARRKLRASGSAEAD